MGAGHRHRFARAAVSAGAEVVTVRGQRDPGERRRRGGELATAGRTTSSPLVTCSPTSPRALLRILLGETEADSKPQGSQLKINLLLDRSPAEVRGRAQTRLRRRCTGRDWPARAAYARRRGGRPNAVGHARQICHTLTDHSILGEAPPDMHADLASGCTPGRALQARPETQAGWRSSVRSRRWTSPRRPDRELPGHRRGRFRPCLEGKIPRTSSGTWRAGPHLPRRPRWPGLTAPGSTPQPGSGGADRRRVGARLQLRRPPPRTVSGLGSHNAAQAVLASR